MITSSIVYPNQLDIWYPAKFDYGPTLIFTTKISEYLNVIMFHLPCLLLSTNFLNKIITTIQLAQNFRTFFAVRLFTFSPKRQMDDNFKPNALIISCNFISEENLSYLSFYNDKIDSILNLSMFLIFQSLQSFYLK